MADLQKVFPGRPQENDTAEKARERYVQAARDAGVSLDQITNFIAANYVAQPKQLLFHAEARKCDDVGGTTWILFGGARGGAKSHAELAQVGIDDCQRHRGLKVLFLRKYMKSAAESIDDLVYKVLQGVYYDYKPSSGTIEFPSTGSKIVIGGFHQDEDIEKYIGVEYDIAVVEEANLISEYRITRLRGSIRSSTDWRARLYLSANPGGIGHAYLKKYFVDPYNNQEESKFLGGATKYIPSTYKDNAFNSKDYIDYLLAIPGPLGEAWREGRWDIFEGMAFPSWIHARHVKSVKDLPRWWPRWWAVDWGYDHPFCALLLTVNPDNGRHYVERELFQRHLTDRQQARLIRSVTPPDVTIAFHYIDPSMFNSKNSGEEGVTSAADEYVNEGISSLIRGDNNRIAGKIKIDRLLADLPDGEPGLIVDDTCRNLIAQFEGLVHKEGTEDTDKEQEDDAIAALRYGLSRLRSPETENSPSAQRARKGTQKNPWDKVKSYL